MNTEAENEKDRPAPSREDALSLCRSLLSADPRLSYGDVRDGGRNLGLHISRWMYSAVQRELAGTCRREAPAHQNREAAEAAEPKSLKEPLPVSGGNQTLKHENRLKSPVMLFVVNYLRERPHASYKEVRKAALEAGITLYPITYGRAQTLLGIVHARPRRSSSKKPTPAESLPVSRRSLVQGTPSPSSNMEHFLQQAEALEGEVMHYRKTLEALRQVLIQALEDEQETS